MPDKVLKSTVQATIETIYRDDYEPDWIEDADDWIQLCEYRQAVITLTQAASKLKKKIDAEIAHRLDGRAGRFEDFLVKHAPSRTLCVDHPDKLFGWLGEDARHAFPANKVRITSIRAIVKARVLKDNPNATEHEIKQSQRAVENSLIRYEEDDPVLQFVPIDRAPKWAQGLEPGAAVQR